MVILEGKCLRMEVAPVKQGLTGPAGVTRKDGEYLQVLKLDVISPVIPGALGIRTTSLNHLLK